MGVIALIAASMALVRDHLAQAPMRLLDRHWGSIYPQPWWFIGSFGFAAALSYVARTDMRVAKITRRTAPVAAIALVVLMALPFERENIAMMTTLADVFGALLVVGMMHGALAPLGRLALLGRYSFGFYVAHYPVLHVLHAHVSWLASMLLSAALAFVLHTLDASVSRRREATV